MVTHPSDHASTLVLMSLYTPGIFDPQQPAKIHPNARSSTRDHKKSFGAIRLTVDETVFSAVEPCDSGIFISIGDDAWTSRISPGSLSVSSKAKLVSAVPMALSRASNGDRGAPFGICSSWNIFADCIINRYDSKS